MSLCNVIIALTTHTILRALLQCKLFLPLHINLKIQIGILILSTHHITHDLANLNVRANEYQGLDQIRVGNSKILPIKHIRTSQISTTHPSFCLNNVLHVPDISNNLIFVHKFTNDTHTLMEFHPFLFRVKDLAMRRLLLHRLSKHGLYPFPPLSTRCVSFTNTTDTTTRTAPDHTSPCQNRS